MQKNAFKYKANFEQVLGRSLTSSEEQYFKSAFSANQIVTPLEFLQEAINGLKDLYGAKLQRLKSKKSCDVESEVKYGKYLFKFRFNVLKIFDFKITFNCEEEDELEISVMSRYVYDDITTKTRINLSEDYWDVIVIDTENNEEIFKGVIDYIQKNKYTNICKVLYRFKDVKKHKLINAISNNTYIYQDKTITFEKIIKDITNCEFLKFTQEILNQPIEFPIIKLPNETDFNFIRRVGSYKNLDLLFKLKNNRLTIYTAFDKLKKHSKDKLTVINTKGISYKAYDLSTNRPLKIDCLIKTCKTDYMLELGDKVHMEEEAYTVISSKIALKEENSKTIEYNATFYNAEFTIPYIKRREFIDTKIECEVIDIVKVDNKIMFKVGKFKDNVKEPKKTSKENLFLYEAASSNNCIKNIKIGDKLLISFKNHYEKGMFLIVNSQNYLQEPKLKIVNV